MALHQKTTHHTGDIINQSLEHDIQDSSSESKYPVPEENHNGADVLEPTVSEERHINTFSNNSNDSEKTVPCDQCDKLFETKQAYELHLKMVHEREKVFMCTICSKSFSQQTTLKAHMTIHEVRTQIVK